LECHDHYTQERFSWKGIDIGFWKERLDGPPNLCAVLLLLGQSG
jgi:hypothetical protein